MVREAIKKMLEEKWRKPQQGSALIFLTKEHIILAKSKEHQTDLKKHDPWKYLSGHSLKIEFKINLLLDFFFYVKVKYKWYFWGNWVIVETKNTTNQTDLTLKIKQICLNNTLGKK